MAFVLASDAAYLRLCQLDWRRDNRRLAHGGHLPYLT